MGAAVDAAKCLGEVGNGRIDNAPSASFGQPPGSTLRDQVIDGDIADQELPVDVQREPPVVAAMVEMHRDVVSRAQGHAPVGPTDERDVLRVHVGVADEVGEGGQSQEIVRVATVRLEHLCPMTKGRELRAPLELAVRVGGVEADGLREVLLVDPWIVAVAAVISGDSDRAYAPVLEDLGFDCGESDSPGKVQARGFGVDDVGDPGLRSCPRLTIQVDGAPALQACQVSPARCRAILGTIPGRLLDSAVTPNWSEGECSSARRIRSATSSRPKGS